MTMPFLLTPGARAAPSPSTLSRLLLPLHLQITNGRHNHQHRHVSVSASASPLLYPRLRNRRGRFFASSSSQMAAPADAPGGSSDAFEVIRVHQAKAARLSPVEEIRTILDRSVRGVLATHSQDHAGYPSGSMVDFACDQDGSPILAVSSLAIHSKNLSGNPKCSLLVAKDPEDRTDTVITVYGDAVPVSDEEKDSVRSAYLRRHPDAFWVDFGDFSFLHIKPKAVRYVSGVATALLGSGEFSAAEYKEAKVDPISQFSTPITSHMNKDHADDTKLIVQHSTAVKVDFAYMLDVDSLGFNVKAGYDGSVLKLRIPFPRQAQDRKDVKTLIVEMLQAARASSSVPE
ncbi:glutamyl-tRNA reductase-binding protein, chloroplastic-like isoform X1 [Miscanthus floridulus]|uniref:glutamyl-tRNA reductase-binding protein, chloroplastic-like isoform X1 n=1 Tax=Miscanthus floridulus TaxID=154761 RepID=UPI003459CDF9